MTWGDAEIMRSARWLWMGGNKSLGKIVIIPWMKIFFFLLTVLLRSVSDPDDFFPDPI